MTPIAISLDAPQAWPWHPGDSAQACWQDWARQVSGWLAGQALDARQALLILPVGAVLAHARAGWSGAVGGWLPRIDTIASLAEGLAWSWAPPPRETDDAWPPLTLDPVLDRLQAGRHLGSQAWGRQWMQRDRRGFEYALDQVVNAAHAWLRRMQAMAPPQRAAYADTARTHLAGGAGAASGPGGRERLLLTWALEWAAHAAQQGLASDMLFEMRPSAFVVTTAGSAISPGTEAHLTLGVMRHLAAQGVPVTWLSATPMPPQDGFQPARPPVLRACVDAQDEAQQAAAQVLRAVNKARAAGAAPQLPVALIALDRSLIRRVRAMLEGAGALIADETGWRLSTTRAAAVLSRTLEASSPTATTDALLDWLKSAWLSEADMPLQEAAGHLEAWCRRHGMVGAWSLQVPPADEAITVPNELPQRVPDGHQAMPASAVRLWHWAHGVMAPLQALWRARRARLLDWLLALRDVLAASGSLQALQQDAAGEMALQALRFNHTSQAADIEQAWQGLCTQTVMDGRAFMRWVAAVLEGATFRPVAPEGPVDVVITPMARAVLRPFHTIVLPGADERQLGALPSQSGWLSSKLCESMNLATPQSLRAAQWDAFGLLMNRPGVVCLHRQAQGSEPLEASPWLEKWSSQTGVAIQEQADARTRTRVPHRPIVPPMPSLAAHPWALPVQLTATTYEALRQCPYRFFATGVLGLREQDELDEGLDRSDFGIWLHEVLRRFHLQRQCKLALSTPEEDVTSWLDTAAEVTREKGLDRDSQRPYFLPFQADLDLLAHSYVQWLYTHEDAGWAVRHAEVVAQRSLAITPDFHLRLHGQIDRVDVRHVQGQRQQMVLDYKTGSADTLKAKVAHPLEDTQLAFYAALSDPADPVAAAYVHLDARGTRQINHPDVEDSAQALLQGIASDWVRLHAGAAMPALGEGAACAFCQARGLCRKDRWTLEKDKDTTTMSTEGARP